MATVKLVDNKSSEWLAHRFYVLGQFDMCFNIVEQILRKSPDNAEALSMKGSVLRARGQIDDALNCFQTAYNLDSENVRHVLEIAKCLYFVGRFQQSLKILSDLPRSTKGNIWEVYHLLGQNQLKLRKLDDAIESFESALDADYRIETVLELLTVYETKDDRKGIQSLVNEALKHYSTNPALRRRIGKIELRLARYDNATNHFKASLARDPHDCQSYLYSGSIAHEHARGDRAMELYRRAFPGLSSSPALWNNVGLCLQVRLKPEAVLACCKRATFYAPFEAVPLVNMGLIFLELGMYCSAAIVLKRARALDIGCPSVNQGLAIALMNVGEYAEAMAILKNELQKSCTIDAAINLAICAYRAGKNEEALAAFRTFRKLLAEEPAHESSYPVRGVLAPMFAELERPE
jgi:Bardet-Biedl syndrome 4 protein